MTGARGRLTVGEVLGLTPLSQALREAVRGLRGDAYSPGHAFGLSSLPILEPVLSLKTWLGWRRRDRRVPIYNLFNRVPGPDGEAHSVRRTYARDFRGRQLTYDGHKATDFVVPVGTVMVAPAPARVARVAREFDRGGLHVCLDHGRGLFTTGSHLARSLVREGQDVARGEPIALSGGAGLDFVLLFPWNVPHIHFNVWLDGVPVDPFAAPDTAEVSLWRTGAWPEPHRGEPEAAFEPTSWVAAAVDETIAGCQDPAMRAELAALEPLERRAAEVLFQRNYRPHRFTARPSLYPERHPREPWLDLPLRASDFVGIALDD